MVGSSAPFVASTIRRGALTVALTIECGSRSNKVARRHSKNFACGGAEQARIGSDAHDSSLSSTHDGLLLAEFGQHPSNALCINHNTPPSPLLSFLPTSTPAIELRYHHRFFCPFLLSAVDSFLTHLTSYFSCICTASFGVSTFLANQIITLTLGLFTFSTDSHLLS